MGKIANPAHRVSKLQSLLAIVCLIVFAAIPMTCTAAILPARTAAQTLQQDCSPCCQHSAPAEIEKHCCALQQNEALARIASAPSFVLEAAPTSDLLHLDPLHACATITLQARAYFSPLRPLIALRI
jgi:hypothetical protein